MLRAKLLAQRKALMDKAEAIMDLASKESRDMTVEENTTFDSCLAGVKKLDSQLEGLVDIPIAAVSAGRISSPENALPNIAVTEGMIDLVSKDPKKGFKSPKDFCMAVIDHGCRRKPKAGHEGLRYLATVGSDEQMEKEDEYGGFLVPSVWSPTLLTTPSPDDPTLGKTRNLPMSAPVISIPARVDKDHSSSVSGGLSVSRRAETAAASAARQKYEKVELRAFALFGLSYITEELLTDSPISFAALIAQSFGEEFRSAIFKEKLNGTGAGEYLGVTNSPCLVTVDKETAQAKDTIVYENVIKMRCRIWGYQNAFWLANQNCLPQLMVMNQTIGTAGIPVWQPSAREDAPDVLLGRPLFLTEYCKTVGDAGDIMLTNWNEFLESTYQPLASEESIHVRFIYHERTFKFWLRNAGGPWWRSALTPVNGDTLSPFVTLAERA